MCLRIFVSGLVEHRTRKKNMTSIEEASIKWAVRKTQKILLVRPSVWVYPYDPLVFGYQTFLSDARAFSPAIRNFLSRIRLAASKVHFETDGACAYLRNFVNTQKASSLQPVDTRPPHFLAYFYVSTIATIVRACWVSDIYQEICRRLAQTPKSWLYILAPRPRWEARGFLLFSLCFVPVFFFFLNCSFSKSRSRLSIKMIVQKQVVSATFGIRKS